MGQIAEHLAKRLSIDVYDDLSQIENEWRAFQKYADGTVFQTFEWLDTWLRHVGAHHAVRPVIVVGRGHRGNPLFLLPLAIEPTRFARALVWLGSDLCDYNGPLLAPEFERTIESFDFPALWQTITREIVKKPDRRYDFVCLDKMPPTVGNQPNPMVQLPTSANPSGAYIATLDQGWEAYYRSKRSSAIRRRDRSKRRRLNQIGDVRFVELDGPAESLTGIETLMSQKSRAFERMGVRNLFERPGYADFFRALAADPELANLVHISRLEVGSEHAAHNFGLTFRGRFYHVLASYTDTPEIARFGPGMAHLHELLRESIERGDTCFDFTIGDERYKGEWCDTRTELRDHAHARTVRGRLVAQAHVAKQKLKRTIKQQPRLMAAFTAWRADGPASLLQPFRRLKSVVPEKPGDAAPATIDTGGSKG